ncbi:hypothetical protein H0H10_20345 [Streptomyces sp. TRM S81-3]|uniref:Uncharacterized protein n=1 Tax=Streptomyces griseicoloratus TaxID=2752516 RepID=A0A926QSY6_9ACTN|nr:hypothetical protein [Streptomyces griseicoloratus]MBD0421477.1 hypothetical protein [Streptomyces griseicoloratus]
MNRHLRRPGPGIAPRHLAGWLFADLFLVLFVVALGMVVSDGPGRPVADASRKPSPSGTASPSPSRTEKGPTGLDPKRHVFGVRLSGGATGRAAGDGSLSAADRQRIVAALDKEVRRSGKGRRIGMVITFGVGPQAMLGAATDLAEDVNRTLKSRRPNAFCGGNVGTRPFWSGGQPDRVEIEVYYINACEAER